MDDKENATVTISDLNLTGVSGSYDHDPYLDIYHGTTMSAGPLLTGGLIDTISITGGGSGYTYTGLGANVAPNVTWSDNIINQSAKISLKGEDADIEVNGESLMDMIRGIQDRLNILCPDPTMEAEWDELRELRQQYEAKLVECREKSRMWKTLQQMPPPEIK